MSENLQFFDQNALVHRLSHGLKRRSQEVVFLLGAGLSAPVSPGKPGVLDANGIVDLIRSEFCADRQQLEEFTRIVGESGGKRYQAAFLFLQGRLGQSAANDIVTKAVMGARLSSSTSEMNGATDEDRRFLELDQRWKLNPGIECVGKLIAGYPHRFGRALLTTNFDPLLEISVRLANGQFYRTTLQSDGNLSQTEGSGCHIIHLHGYWYGSDTLHTARQLQQSRPHLKSSLSDLLRNKLFVVCGYGGWDDVFMDALKEVSRDDAARPEVLWALYSAEPSVEQPLFNKLLAGINRGRVSLYAGIDCNEFFPVLYETWSALESPSHTPITARSNAVTVGESLQETVRNRTVKEAVLEGDDEDRPPMVEFCFGREIELSRLKDSESRVVFLTGIGGEGKSTLAAQYFTGCQRTKTYSYFIWRDCKEESERFENQLASVVETLSRGTISGRDLAGQDPQELVQLVLRLIGDVSVLFVFDNVDHYIDLERCRLISTPELFVQALLSSRVNSRVLFTCRPSVTYRHPFVLTCHLEGISLEATRELFSSRKATCDGSEIEEAHRITNGHAFWLDLLAIQVVKSSSAPLRALLNKIRSGEGSLPEKTLKSIWSTLKDRERLVLRSMAETVRPATEDEIVKYLDRKIQYAKLMKAIAALRALNLIVVKKSPSGQDLLELHPLVRQFVRSNFSKVERSSFIEDIIKVYKTFIGSHKLHLNERPTLTVLQYWTQAVELDIAAGNIKQAFATLAEAMSAFSASAYLREFSRAARLLLLATDWVSEHGKLPYFDLIFRMYLTTVAHLGESGEVDKLLDMYEMTVSERDSRYILYCEMKCHTKWIRGEFPEAVKWGQRGKKLKETSSVDTQFDVSHSLALAERDAGRPEVALPIFLKGRSLSGVIDPGELDESADGPYYGNVGRCLQFMGQIDSALICYQKSALLLEKEPRPEHIVNQGYIRRWIGELLLARKQYRLAGVFLEAARLKWETMSPGTAAKISLLQQQVADQIPRTEGDVERVCQDWILGRYVDADLS